jgi:hypothetical protein
MNPKPKYKAPTLTEICRPILSPARKTNGGVFKNDIIVGMARGRYLFLWVDGSVREHPATNLLKNYFHLIG